MVKEEASCVNNRKRKKDEIFQNIPRKGFYLNESYIFYFSLRRNQENNKRREELKIMTEIGDVFSTFLILNLIFPLECVISIRFEY